MRYIFLSYNYNFGPFQIICDEHKKIKLGGRQAFFIIIKNKKYKKLGEGGETKLQILKIDNESKKKFKYNS